MTSTDHHTALTRVIADLNDANQAEAAAIAKRNAAASEIIGIVARLRHEYDSPRDPAYLAVVRHLYWQHPAVSSTELAAVSGFRSPQEMTAAIGHVPSGLTCSRCQAQIMRTSRSWKAPNAERWSRHLPVLCPGCKSDDQWQRNTEWRIRDLRRKHVDQAQVDAPRVEWAVAAAIVLEYPPIAVGRPDQEGPDQFWHGYELAQNVARSLAESDALRLRMTSYDADRLVKEAIRLVGWDVARTWNAVTPITDEAPTAALTRLDVRVREMRERRVAEAAGLYPDDYEPADGWTY